MMTEGLINSIILLTFYNELSIFNLIYIYNKLAMENNSVFNIKILDIYSMEFWARKLFSKSYYSARNP